MVPPRGLLSIFFFLISLLVLSQNTDRSLNVNPVFPGLKGFGLDTKGGQGGRIIRVTNLNGDGPGSLSDAVKAAGPRIVVFEIAGVIDLKGRSIGILNPYITIAGHTAPSPGITLIRGGINIGAHEVIIQHLKVRPGEAGKEKRSGWDVDG